jgi:hypothetical protein
MEARMRIVLITMMLAASSSLALAQSWTATTGTTAPTTSTPGSKTQGITEPKSKIPPPANSQTRGIHVGNDVKDAGSIEIKENK